MLRCRADLRHSSNASNVAVYRIQRDDAYDSQRDQEWGDGDERRERGWEEEEEEEEGGREKEWKD